MHAAHRQPEVPPALAHQDRVQLLRRQVQQPPPYPLGPAGGAGGVEHHRSGPPVAGRGAGPALDELGDREGVRRDHHLGAAVGDDVVDLLGCEVPVDGYEIDADLVRRQHHGQGVGPVLQHGHDAVAGADSARGQAARGLVDPVEQRSVGHARVAEEGRAFRVFGRDLVETPHVRRPYRIRFCRGNRGIIPLRGDVISRPWRTTASADEPTIHPPPRSARSSCPRSSRPSRRSGSPGRRRPARPPR